VQTRGQDLSGNLDRESEVLVGQELGRHEEYRLTLEQGGESDDAARLLPQVQPLHDVERWSYDPDVGARNAKVMREVETAGV
jgi:hypothetical protein